MSESFVFTPTNLKQIKEVLKRYPKDHQNSAVMPLLDLAQKQNGGWLSTEAIEAVAAYLNMPVIRVLEVATFYSMYHLKPVGQHVINICRTTPCWLKGSDSLTKACKNKLGINPGETSNNITVLEVECLGACRNAPVVQVNDEYVEDVTPEQMEEIVSSLGKPVEKKS